MGDRAYLSALLALATAIMAAGTVFFRFVEGWSWLDAYFFTAVTVTTVGYGNLVPETAFGKIGATVLIFAGIGVIAATLAALADRMVKRRLASRDEHPPKA